MAELEDERESHRSFYERSSFKAIVAVVGLLSAVWAFLGPPSPFQAAKELTKADPLPYRNVEVILDASSRMGEPFGDATKLDVAAEAVGRWAAGGEGVGLALRRAGGACDEPTDPVVGFDDGQSAKVTEAAKGLEPGGAANWGLAVRSAIGDFSGAEFQRPGSENQIVIFVGGNDQCGGNVGPEIRNELEHANLNAQFRFFALGVSKREQESLKALKRQLKPVAEVEVNNADTVKQLYRAVREDVGDGDGGGGPPPRGGNAEGGEGASGEDEAEASGAEAEALQLDEVEPQLEEETVVEPNQEEIEAREREEEEVREKEQEEEAEREELEEAEEEAGVEPAEEAPEETPEPEEEGETGSLEESKPVPVPEAAATPREGRFSLRNKPIPPMTPPWTLRPSPPPGSESSPWPDWGSLRGSWSSTPWSRFGR
ncbi:MAG TPA: hypothetical protein VFJ61_02030 [Solirubrobacterales bacterium]|nr:hypothetical protein [Solirubrobacterales bacterium]